MRAIETIKNIWKIEDLRKRIITTILLVLVYRVGSYVVLPGIDPANLDALRSQTSKGLMQLLDMFREEHSPMLLYLHWVLCLISPPRLLSNSWVW